MTKEKEAEKIMLVLDKAIRHTQLEFEYSTKKGREALEYEMQEMKEKETIRLAVEAEKCSNERKYMAACERLKGLRDYARMMFEALNIEDPFDIKYNEIGKKEAEAIEKLQSKNFDEQAELEKFK